MSTKTKEQGTSLITVEPESFAVMQADAHEVLAAVRENLDGQQIKPNDLDRIKVPAGGGLSWTVPGPDGENEEKTITGVIIHKALRRAFWKDDYTGQKNPPDCFSNDCLVGIGDPGVECQRCQYAQFGSKGTGKAQACKQFMQIFVVRETDILPMMIVVPPSSLKNMKDYFLRIAGKAHPYWSVVSNFTLTKDKNEGGIVYSKIVPSMAAPLTKEVATRFKAYGDTIRPVLDAARADDLLHVTEVLDN